MLSTTALPFLTVLIRPMADNGDDVDTVIYKEGPEKAEGEAVPLSEVMKYTMC